MIISVLGLLSAFFELCKVLIEKYAPAKATPTFKRGAEKSVEYFHGKTIEQIARIGKKRGLIK